MSLTARQRQHLKGLGHSLRPVIQIGKEGLTERVVASISTALNDHELIKLGLLETADLDRKEAAVQIAERVGAEVVQVLGFKILLFRQNQEPEKRKVKLP